MSSSKTRALDKGNYVSFATRKRSGDFVQTPVWFAPDGDSYYLFSAGDAGKVKRLRNFSESRIARCTMSGRVTGEWVSTESFLLDQSTDIDTALQALHRKYGWQMKLTDLGSRLSGKIGARTYIRVDPVGD